MLYDRATTEADMPRYLLLMGDCMWDNRMLTPACSNLSADDYLLCYESENSFNDVYCYVDDGFFALLDDGEGGNPLSADKLDVAVGRLPVTTANEAKNMVDKIIRYAANNEAGDWQNTIMFMGDDGNSNIHMRDVNAVADDIAARYPGFLIKKVMWDAYNEETSSTGNRYPEVSALIKAQQQAGALIMDYGGHGIEYQISHERVLELNDFKTFTNTHLPLWITASCDIMPFDGTKETIGEQAVLNAQGGAIAFFGTARTVITTYNKEINHAFLNYVLSLQNGKPTTIGEAQRLAKNQMITDRLDLTCNKLQYALLGDPALALPLPTLTAVVDSINGEEVAASALPTMKAGQRVRISGHIENAPHFTGLVSITVRDSRELITCKMNNSAETTRLSPSMTGRRRFSSRPTAYVTDGLTSSSPCLSTSTIRTKADSSTSMPWATILPLPPPLTMHSRLGQPLVSPTELKTGSSSAERTSKAMTPQGRRSSATSTHPNSKTEEQ